MHEHPAPRGEGLESHGGTIDEIALVARDVRMIAVDDNVPCRRFKAQRIREGNFHKERGDIVITVGPRSMHGETKVDLGRRLIGSWRALFVDGDLRAGDAVLLEGTGGVSIFGLQLAAAAGATPIITSSSDAKLERARALGAAGTVNYRTNPEWQEHVLALTDGAGVDHVLDVVGQETLNRAIETLAYDGHIAIIGGLSGRADALPLRALPNGASATNIYVGSREDFEAMNEFLAEHELRPVVDRVFPFEEAAAAYEYMESGAHLGKVVISVY